MSDHKHEWAVDASCECGLMISEHARTQAAQIAALEAENKERAEIIEMHREARKALEAEVERLRNAEIAQTMLVIETAKLVEPSLDLAPFVALARAAENVLKYWGGGEMEHDYPRSQLKELRAALASPAVLRAVKEAG